MSKKQKPIGIEVIPKFQFLLEEDWWKKGRLEEDECLYFRWPLDTKMELRKIGKRKFQVEVAVELHGGPILAVLESKEAFREWPAIRPLPYGLEAIPEGYLPKTGEKPGEKHTMSAESPQARALVEDAVSFCEGMLRAVWDSAPKWMPPEQKLRGVVKLHNLMVDQMQAGLEEER